MNLFADLPPALILLVGALLAPFLGSSWRSLYVIALPLLALIHVLWLDPGEHCSLDVLPFTAEPLQFLRVDGLSRAFGVIFSLNAAAVFLYAFHVRRSTQHVAALVYVGSALGAVFAGDLLSLYAFWEAMAVSSTFIILSRNTAEARAAGFRYVMVHLFGGLLLLAGIAVTIARQDGSIAFEGFDFATAQHAGTWLILLGILVNAAAPPLSAWLPDAYPAASVTGGVLLSAYTTKTAVYTLLRGFPGWEPLIWIGCIMAVYGVVYALMENDGRRLLAYAIINQVGFMLCAAGIGTAEAISGATAAAFCHILYKSLLWMAAGAVLYRTGRSRLSELGGLGRSMPLTAIFCVIGAISMAAPGTCGFTSKTIIIHAAQHEHLLWPWLILEMASAGIFLAAGLRFPWFVFFGKDSGLRPREAPRTMVAAMALLAFLCLFFGLLPGPLYGLLPQPIDYQPYTPAHVVVVLQLLAFAALAFFLLRPWLAGRPGRSVDFDWFYRRGAPLFRQLVDRSLNGINAAVSRAVVGGVVPRIANFFESGASRLTCAAMTPLWMLQGHRGEALEDQRRSLFRRSRRGAFPIGITAFCAVILLGLLSLISLLEQS